MLPSAGSGGSRNANNLGMTGSLPWKAAHLASIFTELSQGFQAESTPATEELSRNDRFLLKFCGPPEIPDEPICVIDRDAAVPPAFLRLAVLSASRLAASGFSTSNPYVIITFQGKTHKTRSISKTLNPVWNDLWEVEIVGREAVVTMKIYSDDFMRRDELLGICTFIVYRSDRGINRQLLDLDNTPGQIRSRMNVIYHVTDSVENQSDLIKLASTSVSLEDSNVTHEYAVTITLLDVKVDRPLQDMIVVPRVILGGRRDGCTVLGPPVRLRNGRVGIIGDNEEGWTHTFYFDADRARLLSTKLIVDLNIAPDSLIDEHEKESNREKFVGMRQERSEEKRKFNSWRLRKRNSTSPKVIVDSDNDDVVVEVEVDEQPQSDQKMHWDSRRRISSTKVENDWASWLARKEKLAAEGANRNRRTQQRDGINNSISSTSTSPLELLGSWEECLDVIEADLEEQNAVETVVGICYDRSSNERGSAKLMVDVHTTSSGPHEYRYDIKAPPRSKGLFAAAKASVFKPYWLYAFADFLPAMDVANGSSLIGLCDPFIRISVGRESIETSHLRKIQRRVAWQPIQVYLRGEQKTRVDIELMDEDSFGGGLIRTEDVIGYLTLWSIRPNERKWFHMYGGRVHAPQADFDRAMLRGGCNPPSTYRGSLCLSWDTRKPSKKKGWPPRDDGVSMRLEVRLFRGLYILDDRYRGQEVKVTVKVGGCQVPKVGAIPRKVDKSIKSFLKGSAKPQKGQLLVEEEDEYETCDMTDVLLNFYGRVNEAGVLRFYSTDSPDEAITAAKTREELVNKQKEEFLRETVAAKGGLFSRLYKNLAKKTTTNNLVEDPIEDPKAAVAAVVNDPTENDTEADAENIDTALQLIGDSLRENITTGDPFADEVAWVQRQTPALVLLPGVQFAYLYLSRRTDVEAERVFGRIDMSDAKKTVRRDDICTTNGDNNEIFSEFGGISPVVMTSGGIAKEDLTLSSAYPMANWHRLYYDQSLVELPKMSMSTNFSGCVLGWARMLSMHDIQWKEHQRFAAATYGLPPPRRLSLQDMRAYLEEHWSGIKKGAATSERSIATAQGVCKFLKKHKDDDAEGRLHGAEMSDGDSDFDNTFSKKKLQGVVEEEEPDKMPIFHEREFQLAKKTVYLHLDILQGSNLPAMHEDALADPLWEVLVENKKCAPLDSQVPKSMNPTFLHRSAISIEVYLPASIGTKEEDNNLMTRTSFLRSNILSAVAAIPLPPVILTLKNLHEGAPKVQEVIGISMEWSPAILDDSENFDTVPPGYGPPVNRFLNHSHIPKWYLLSDEAPLSIQAAERNAWKGRVKMLCCFGYSVLPPAVVEVPGVAPNGSAAAVTDISMGLADKTYQFRLDLLGIRDVPPSAFPSRPRLDINSWCGQVEVKMDEDILPEELSFKSDLPTREEFRDFKFRMKRHAIQHVQSIESFGERTADKRSLSGSSALGGSESLVVPSPYKFVGVRVELPPFRSPPLPYLGVKADGNPFVLLPDISFRLRQEGWLTNFYKGKKAWELGGKEIGTLSLPLQNYLKNAHAGQKLTDLCYFHTPSSDDTKQPTLLQSIPENQETQIGSHGQPQQQQLVNGTNKRLARVKPRRSAGICEIVVDVFSEMDGKLTYDGDIFVGRHLRDQDIFFVTNDVGRTETFYFNAGDYFVNNEVETCRPFENPILRLNPNDNGHGHWKFEDGAGASREMDEMKQTGINTTKKTDSNNRQAQVMVDDLNSRRAWPLVTTETDAMSVRSNDSSFISRLVKGEWKPQNSTLHIPRHMRLSTGKPSTRPLKVTKALGFYEWEFNRTFIRSVGHVISDRIRGSRILARLKMCVLHPGDSRIIRESYSMVNIKSVLEGEVVWRSAKGEFTVAGEPIMVIRSSEDKLFYPIVVPSFDIRYPSESAFYVRRTVMEKWRELEWQAVANEHDRHAKIVKKALAQHGKKKAAPKKKESEGLSRTVEGIRDSLSSFGESVKTLIVGSGAPDGHYNPLRIKSGQFALRLKRVMRREGYDRPQCGGSVDWHDAIDCVPVVNMRQNFLWGADCKAIGTLKASITAELVKPESNHTQNLFASIPRTHVRSGPLVPVSRRDPQSLFIENAEPPLKTTCPLDSMWRFQPITIHLYVLTGRRLVNMDSTVPLDPSLLVRLGQQEMNSERVHTHTANPDFYEHFELRAKVPGESELKVFVLDKKKSIIGEVSIDVENRWLAYCRELENTRSEFEKSGPFLGPKRPFPLEILDVRRKGSTDALGIHTGSLRVIVDLVPDDDDLLYDDVPIEDCVRIENFDIRLVIWRVEGITIFKDLSRRNDVVFEITLISTAFDGRRKQVTQRTDCHKFAQDVANFNWRMIFPISVPAYHIELLVKMIDVDNVGADSFIYSPTSYQLDHLARVSYNRQIDGEMPLPPLNLNVNFMPPKQAKTDAGQLGACIRMTWCVFTEFICCCLMDCFPQPKRRCDDDDLEDLNDFQLSPYDMADGEELDRSDEDIGTCHRCLKRFTNTLGCSKWKKPMLNNPAVLKAQVQFLPKAISEANPVGKGREEPNKNPHLPPPKDRIDWSMALKDPIEFIKILMGPDNFNCLKFCTCSIILITFCAFIALVLSQLVVAGKQVQTVQAPAVYINVPTAAPANNP